MKRIITMFLISLAAVMLFACQDALAKPYSVQFDENTSYTSRDLEELQTLINEQQNIRNSAHNMAEAARNLGYSESHPVIVLAKQEYADAMDLQKRYESVYNDLAMHQEEKENEYPEATYIWNYLVKDMGLSNAAAAGIMGNLMAEVGGQTLALNVYASNKSYYGMCQWNKAYSEVWGASLEEQCDFLSRTIKYELDTYGYKYKKGFKYSDFKNMSGVKSAAAAFMQAYERCGSESKSQRKANAVVAYNYFVG